MYTSTQLTNRFYVISFMRSKNFEMILEYNLCNSACSMLYYIYCLQNYNTLNITIYLIHLSTQCWVLISQNINITNVVQQRSKVLADNFHVQTEKRLLYKLNNTEVVTNVIYILLHIFRNTYIYRQLLYIKAVNQITRNSKSYTFIKVQRKFNSQTRPCY